jgi:PTH2 family peptidyl-tRNA hydrolase
MISTLIKNILPRSAKMALIVRSDLKLSKGKIASQCSHAAVLCYQTALKSNSKLASQWSSMGQPKIVLKVDSLNELEILYKTAKDKKLIVELVQDAGRTQVAPGTKTTIGLLDYSDSVDVLTKELKLL